MHFDTELHASAPIPDWLEPKEARQRLYHEMSDFISSVAEEKDVPDEVAPAIAFKVTAGLGKTSTALRILAEQGSRLLQRGHVMIYMPTLDLADRAARDFAALGTGLPIQVIRGRTAPRSDDPDTPMCNRHDLVRQVQGLVPSITQSLCRARSKSGKIRHAPCAQGCHYLAQKEVTGTRIIFLAHTYLDALPPIDQRVPVAIRIIDEKVWSTRVKTMQISLDDFLDPPGAAFPTDLQEEYLEARTKLVAALRVGKSVSAALQDKRFACDRLEAFCKAEAEIRPELEIFPWDPRKTTAFRIDMFDRRAFQASRKRQAIFRRLAQDDPALDAQLTLGTVKEKGETRRVIKLHSFRSLPRDAPLMLLDADADPEITNRLAEGARFVPIEAKPEAEIIQVSGK
ncbi:hypothetical protein SAMN05421853_11645 [Roseivivax halotolerans]|uniref:Type III restriction enzyme, res subunit n=1 Tax=Roseivivax halotolerans TaxID=93684 RepID=A0A1I6A9D6_9RHOB|nr:hypothetical protein [Roseivivax halotolerans]SFQ65331.1 hypothetical protein SAMN05421853_11645 [Roseivivax halotolerans]